MEACRTRCRYAMRQSYLAKSLQPLSFPHVLWPVTEDELACEVERTQKYYLRFYSPSRKLAQEEFVACMDSPRVIQFLNENDLVTGHIRNSDSSVSHGRRWTRPNSNTRRGYSAPQRPKKSSARCHIHRYMYVCSGKI
jgi:hypothetical protein